MGLGTPTWNPNGKVGSSFQSGRQGLQNCPPDCSGEGGISLPPEFVTIYANYTKFELTLWRWQQRIGVVDTYLTGIVDEINPLAKYGRHLGNRISERLGGFSFDPVNENSRVYSAGGWTGFAATVIVPGGAEEEGASVALTKGVEISEHALERAAQRGFSESMIKAVIRNGQKFYDPANGSINYVIREGFASGKSALVAVNPFTGRVATVIRGSRLIRGRFVPLK